MVKISKTMGPLHFEDLEPHKFEDVVRGLLYDFRNWQSIEPTGKKGSDDGFDVRAWEKVNSIENTGEEKEEDEEQKGEHPMEGNLWMIQCKREKEITPKKIEEVLKDIDPKNPPYGYILAVATDFSKKTHDVFREILSKKGVKEFYLWGKSYLEDMLYLPKNDYLLFTAFGISLNTQRRSRKTEIKFELNNKNKVFRIWGPPSGTPDYKPALIRDFNDSNYPYESEYPDFNKIPRWIEYMPFQYGPLGLWFHARIRYAYIDKEKKEFDVFEDTDLLSRKSDMRLGKNKQKDEALETDIRNFWEQLPMKNQAKFSVEGFVAFKDMLVIDDKGDYLYDFPHIYVEFNKNTRFFSRYMYVFKTDKGEIYLEDDYKRIKIFPDKITPTRKGKIHKDKLDIDYKSLGLLKGQVSPNGYLFGLKEQYKFNKNEIVIVPYDIDGGSSIQEMYLEITNVYDTTVNKFISQTNTYPYREFMTQQLKADVKDEDEIRVFEVRHISKWEAEEKEEYER